jgi:hypothetical protein
MYAVKNINNLDQEMYETFINTCNVLRNVNIITTFWELFSEFLKKVMIKFVFSAWRVGVPMLTFNQNPRWLWVLSFTSLQRGPGESVPVSTEHDGVWTQGAVYRLWWRHKILAAVEFPYTILGLASRSRNISRIFVLRPCFSGLIWMFQT